MNASNRQFNRLSARSLPDSQSGITLLGLLAVLVVVAFVGLIAIRLTPVYLESLEVGSVLRSMERDDALHGASRADLRSALNRRLQVNNIDSVGRDDVQFNDAGHGMEIVVDYEVRVPLVANLDAIAKFRKEALIPR